MKHTFLKAVETILGECGLLVCHIGKAETMQNLPLSYIQSRNATSTATTNPDTPPNIDDTNRWVLLIDTLQHMTGFQNIVDYNEHDEKFVVGMKCKQCRANWIWNPALFQIQMAKRMSTTSYNDFFDGPAMIQYQFPSRIVEEVWCRDDYDDNDDSFCRGHGYDPEIVNVPVSSLIVNTSLVANGGRGVFTTQPIQKGSYIIVDDCVNGIIVPIPTLDLLETASDVLTNVSEFWEVVSDGFMDGYGWMDNFLVRDNDDHH
jgi:hypothetical protein